MHHFLICKYNYDDPAYVDEWTTLSALLRSTGSQFPSQDYLQLEQAFLDIVVQFFKAHADRSFRFRFCYICGDHKVQDPSSGNLQSLLLPLPDGLALIGKPFEAFGHKNPGTNDPNDLANHDPKSFDPQSTAHAG